jgi:hypothetical protein
MNIQQILGSNITVVLILVGYTEDILLSEPRISLFSIFTCTNDSGRLQYRYTNTSLSLLVYY